jgi:hypothetical protein
VALHGIYSNWDRLQRGDPRGVAGAEACRGDLIA